MPKIKNISPFGDLEVPLLGVIFEHGTILDVTDEQAEILLRQSDNFQAWGEAAHKAERRAAKQDEQVGDKGVAPIAAPAEEA